MVDAEPVLNARTSISRMIGAVEQAVSHRSPGASEQNPNSTNMALSSVQAGPEDHRQPPSSHETTFTSIPNDFIYLSDRQNQMPVYQAPQQFATPADSAASLERGTSMVDPMSLLDFDVLTTDLYNFFPIQTPQPDIGFGQSDQM